MAEVKIKKVFIVWSNTDLTEGRGYPVAAHVCELRATALRLAKGAGVMGSDADVQEFQAIYHAGNWCVPRQITPATQEDKEAQYAADVRAQAIARAKAAGLTDADLRDMGVTHGR